MMNENYFSEMLLASNEDLEMYLKKLKSSSINSYDYISRDLLKAILILWMHNFFHNSDGYGKFKPFLGEIFSNLFAENIAESYCNNVLKYLETYCRKEKTLGMWFYKHCWMISGEKCGATSKMPRPVLNYLDDKDEGLENEDYATDPIFENMLQDKSSAENFYDIIHNISEYPVLEEAIKRFRKMASAEIDWYLCKNGYSMKVILGIKKIRLPESDTSATIEVMIKFKNEEIKITVARTHDRVEVPIEDIKKSDKLKIYINGRKIDEIDCSAVFSRFENIDTPLCFSCPMNPTATWFKLLPEKMEYPYNKNAIWIVSAVEAGGNMVVNKKSFKCERIELKLSEKLQPYIDENGYELFEYQKTREYITIEGNRSDIYDDAHKWIIFSGEKLVLTSMNQDEWNTGIPRYECIPNNSQSPCSFSVKNKRKKNFSILYLPEEFVKKCQTGKAWESGGWKYEPEIIPKHANVVCSIQNGIYGTLSMPDGKTLTLFVNIEPSEQIYWLEENWQSYEQLENIDIRDFESYGDMEKYKLCFPFQLKNKDQFDYEIKSFEVKRFGADTWEKFPIVATVGGRYKWISLQDLTSKINPSISNGCDEIRLGNCSFKVKCRPSTPQILVDNNCGKIYIPEKEKKNYSLVILSEKALESFSDEDWKRIPCSELSMQVQDIPIQDIPIPEVIKKNPQAIYATLINASPKLDLLPLLQKQECIWKKIRNSEKPIEKLFQNSAVLELVLPMLPQSENFSDAKEFVLCVRTPNPQELWVKFAGKANSPYNIPEILKIMLEKGFNFLAEPLPSPPQWFLSFGYTWQSAAFKTVLMNYMGRENNLPRVLSFSKAYKNQLRSFEKHEGFFKIFLDNQDLPPDDQKNWILGQGWLPTILFQNLLEDKMQFGKKAAKQNPPDKKAFEQCGIREISKINQFEDIWGKTIARIIEKRQSLEDIKNDFLSKQTELYNEKLWYLNDEENILYDEKTFEDTSALLKKILNELKSPCPDGTRINFVPYILEMFFWILENIEELVKNKKEDLNHAVLGITAIACRLVAHSKYSFNDNAKDKDLLLSNVHKAFMDKYRNKNGDCWRFLMHYLPPVDLVLWFYNTCRAYNEYMNLEY